MDTSSYHSITNVVENMLNAGMLNAGFNHIDQCLNVYSMFTYNV